MKKTISREHSSILVSYYKVSHIAFILYCLLTAPPPALQVWGKLLAVITKDRSNGIFHISFSIVDKKIDNNWAWFMEMLKEVLNGGDGRYEEDITSDRLKGLINVITTIFLDFPHVYYL